MTQSALLRMGRVIFSRGKAASDVKMKDLPCNEYFFGVVMMSSPSTNSRFINHFRPPPPDLLRSKPRVFLAYQFVLLYVIEYFFSADLSNLGLDLPQVLSITLPR